MTKALEQAMDVRHTAGTTGPMTLTLATTANGEKVTIPSEWRGRLVEFTALGANAGVRFGAAATVAVDMTTAGGGTRPAYTAGGKEPHLVIPNGGTRPERIPTDTTIDTFAHIGDGSGKLYVCLATGDGS